MFASKRGLPVVAACLLLFMIMGAAAGDAPSDEFDIAQAVEDGRVQLRVAPPGADAAPCAHSAALGLDEGGTPAMLPPSFEGCNQGIRPGLRMSSPAGCTFNFVFQSGSTYYIGTAGHCVDGVGQRVSAPNVGPFGTVVFRQFAGSMDFALIRIDADKNAQVNPRMCTWGGPTGIAPTGGAISTDPLLEYGWGVATQFAAQTRSRVHDEFLSSSNVLSWNGVGSGGDSGAPMIRADGAAVGIHTWGLTPVAGAVLESGPSMTAIMSALQGAGWNVQLVSGGPGGL